MLKKLLFLIVRLFEAAFVSLLFALCILIYRLNEAPIPLEFLRKYVVANFSFEERGIRAEVDSIVLTLQKELNPIGVRVYGFRIKDNEEKLTLLDVPEASLNFSWLAFFKGELLPKEMKLYGSSVQLPTRLFKEGQLQTDTPVVEQGFSSLRLFLQENYFEHFERIQFENAKIALLEKNKRPAVFWPDLNVDITRDKNRLFFKTDFQIRQGRERKKFEVAADYDFFTRSLNLSFSFDPFVPSTFKNVLPFLSQFTATTEGSFSFHAPLPKSFTLSDIPALAQATDMSLTLSKGFVPILYNDEIFYIDKMRLHSSYSPKEDAYFLKEFSLSSYELSLLVSGVFYNASGFSDASKEPPTGLLQAKGNFLSIKQLLTLWPKVLAADPRDWLAAHFKQATFKDLDFTFHISGTSGNDFLFPTKLEGSASVEDASLTYLDGMPGVENAYGKAAFALDSIDIHLERARTYDLKLKPGSRVHLFDLTKDTPQISVDLKGTGPLSDAIRLIDSPKLKLADDIGISPDQVTGDADVNFFLNVPIDENITEKDATIRVSASATDVNVFRIFNMPYSIDRGNLLLNLSEKGLLTINADAYLEKTIPISFFLKSSIYDAKQLSEAEIMAFVTQEDFKLFGLHFIGIQDIVPVYVSLLIDHAKDTKRISVFSDLTETPLDLFFPLYSKEKDTPAGVTATALVDKKGIQGSFFLESGTDILFNGAFSFDRHWDLDRLSLSQLYPDARLNLYLEDDRSLHFILSGKTFKMDLFPFADYLSTLPIFIKETSAPPSFFEAVVDFDSLYLSKTGKPFHDVSAILFFEDGRLAEGDVSAFFDGEQLILPFQQQPDGSVTFGTKVKNIAGLLSRIDVLPFIVSGDLSISGQIAPSGSIKGAFSAKHITMKDPPLLVSVLSKASLTALVQAISGSDIPFDTGALFTFNDSVLAIQKSYLRGAGMGMLQTGSFNFETGRMNIRGSIIPAYSVNSLPGRIPILGLLFSGAEEGGGLFAMTYRVKGPFKKPDISINPLSFLAPGIFRAFFTGDDPLDSIPPEAIPSE